MKKDTDLGIFILRISMGLLFIIPGLFKIFQPADFIGFLEMLPAFLAPYTQFLFYAATMFELIAGGFLVLGYKVRLIALPAAALLLVALVTVVIPDAAVSKIGLINILFHISGIGIFISFLFLPKGKWSIEN